jgi:hypothetical protein
MQWPYKTSVRFQSFEGIESRLDYWVSAANGDEAERTLKERLTSNEVFGYRAAGARPATKDEAAWINLPPNCVMLLA